MRLQNLGIEKRWFNHLLHWSLRRRAMWAGEPPIHIMHCIEDNTKPIYLGTLLGGIPWMSGVVAMVSSHSQLERWVSRRSVGILPHSLSP